MAAHVATHRSAFAHGCLCTRPGPAGSGIDLVGPHEPQALTMLAVAWRACVQLVAGATTGVVTVVRSRYARVWRGARVAKAR
jgi:hypothetical protein